MIAGLSQVKAPFSVPNIPTILTVHGLILNLLSGLTIDNQSARSFVSKYLHFHNPIVPIYDSVAAGFLPKFISVRGVLIPTAEHADSTYSEYLYRFARLTESAASQGTTVTVRSLDYYLLWKKENG